MAERALDISCIDLDALRTQTGALGCAVLSNRRPITAARYAILESILPSGLVRLQAPDQTGLVEVPIVSDPFHQQMIRLSREEAKLSGCWWRKVGCVLANPDTEEVIAKTHNDPVGEGNFCRGLDVDPQEVVKLLVPGERLEFCHARHAENAMAAYILRSRLSVEGLDLGVSLEPCDHCANFLAGVGPKGVYVDFDPGKNKYYDSLGIRVLQSAKIPVYFVRVPEDE